MKLDPISSSGAPFFGRSTEEKHFLPMRSRPVGVISLFDSFGGLHPHQHCLKFSLPRHMVKAISAMLAKDRAS